MDWRAHHAPNDHPQRIELANEIHARPSEALGTPERITYVAVTVSRKSARLSARIWPRCARVSARRRHRRTSTTSAPTSGLRIKWERHTEFTGYGFYVQGLGSDGFDEPAITLLPEGWLTAIPGHTIAAADVVLERFDGGGEGYATMIGRYFPSSAVVGAEIGDGDAQFNFATVARSRGTRRAREQPLVDTRGDRAREADQALLESMEARARMQLRLQETVEGLSIAAITYYGAGLWGISRTASAPLDITSTMTSRWRLRFPSSRSSSQWR